MSNLFKSQNGALPAGDEPIGLVAGSGNLPRLISEAVRKEGRKLVVASICGDAEDSLSKEAKQYQSFSMQKSPLIIDYMRKNNVRHVFLAGGIPKKDLYRPDFKPDRVFKSIFKLARERGDDRLLKAGIAFLKMRGIHVLSLAKLLHNRLTPKGAMTKRQPSQSEMDDIYYGYKVAKEIGKLDIGQTIIVKNKTVFAVEAMEGTDMTIMRMKDIGVSESVVIKCSKPKQDLKIDIPTIGFNTVKSIVEASCSVLALESGKSLFLDQDEAVNFANNHNVTLFGI